MLRQEAIQERSYRIWEHEGRPHGRDGEHWRRAELELIADLQRLHDEAAAEAASEPKAQKPKKKSEPKSGKGARKTKAE